MSQALYPRDTTIPQTQFLTLDDFDLEWELANFVKGQVGNVLGFVSYSFCFSYSTLPHSEKSKTKQNTAIENVYMVAYGCLPIKLSLQNQAAGQIWP